MDAEVIRSRENNDQINETVRTMKKTLSEKNSYIDQMHNKVALLNTVSLLTQIFILFLNTLIFYFKIKGTKLF